MHRRRVLGAIGAGYIVGTCGCLGIPLHADEKPNERLDSGETQGTKTARLAERGDPSNICERSIKYDPGIYAIVEPSFGDDWTGIDVDSRYGGNGKLADDVTVIGVDEGESPRAYPLNVLGIHEIVNDRIEGSTGEISPETTEKGRPIIVTYCPLCRSGLVAERVVDNAPTTFLVSGLLWEPPSVEGRDQESSAAFGLNPTGGVERSTLHSSNLVMYDTATESYWSQILATAICGSQRGSDLGIVPSSVTTWGDWRTDHPDGEVLLPPPASVTSRPQ